MTAHRGFVGDDEVAVLEWPAPARFDPETLTAAEKAVLELLLEGLSNAEIAARRRTSPRTVVNQVASIFGKLGVRSRAALFAGSAARATPGGAR